MKTNHNRAGAKNNRAAKSTPAHKTTSQPLKAARATAPRVRLKVPMPPALLRAVESAAQQLGISRDEFITRAIQAKMHATDEARRAKLCSNWKTRGTCGSRLTTC